VVAETGDKPVEIKKSGLSLTAAVEEKKTEPVQKPVEELKSQQSVLS
jgi:hypothetical protein